MNQEFQSPFTDMHLLELIKKAMFQVIDQKKENPDQSANCLFSFIYHGEKFEFIVRK